MGRVKPRRNEKSVKSLELDCIAISLCEAQYREDSCLWQRAFGFLAMIATDKELATFSSTLFQTVSFFPKLEATSD